MSLHKFDPEIAEKVGVNAAILFENFCHWTRKNMANDRHCYDGEYWTYNSLKAFGELFPYLSVDQIRTALKKLEEANLIKRGNFNNSAYDRTTWFCVLSLIHLGKSKNGSGENPKSYKGTDSNTDKNTDTREAFKAIWETIAPRLKPSRRGSKEKVFQVYSRRAKEIGTEELNSAVRAFYADPDIAKKNYDFAPGLIPCLRQRQYEPYVGVESSELSGLQARLARMQAARGEVAA